MDESINLRNVATGYLAASEELRQTLIGSLGTPVGPIEQDYTEMDKQPPPVEEGTRWSGADWASEKQDIMLVGVGGIGSWLALALSRIGHELYLVDGDIVDRTNVSGGQAYFGESIGIHKVNAARNMCRRFGCNNPITTLETNYDGEIGMTEICITGLDNMAAREEVFLSWKKYVSGYNLKNKCLFVDGRLTLETLEIFAIKGDDEEAIEAYEEHHLFGDEEVAPIDCTTKQTTFTAMMIASLITSVLCNFLTNNKIGDSEFRSVPFYQRMYVPLLMYTTKNSRNEEIV